MIELDLLPKQELDISKEKRIIYIYIYISTYAWIEDILCFSNWYVKKENSLDLDVIETIRRCSNDFEVNWKNFKLLKKFRNKLCHCELFDDIVRIGAIKKSVYENDERMEEFTKFNLIDSLRHIFCIYNDILKHIFDNFTSFEEISKENNRFSKRHLVKLFRDSKTIIDIKNYVKKHIDSNSHDINELLKSLK